jgi:hypothetical protein
VNIIRRSAPCRLGWLDLAAGSEGAQRGNTGTSGVLLKTGIVRYCGHYVCDGLVSDVVILGRNYLRGFTSTYTALKARGRFETEFTNDTLA